LVENIFIEGIDRKENLRYDKYKAQILLFEKHNLGQKLLSHQDNGKRPEKTYKKTYEKTYEKTCEKTYENPIKRPFKRPMQGPMKRPVER